MLYQKHKTLFDKYEVNTKQRIAHFMAQIDHESNLKPISESLHYTSASRARAIFYTPFKGKTDAFINGYLRNTIKMANYVYANKNGNGNEASGDGFKFRGRGFIQVTGRNNYKALSDYTGTDYVGNPDLLLSEVDALISALWYWKTNNLNSFADRDLLDAISDKINLGRVTSKVGDSNGYTDRLNKLNKWKALL